MNNHLNSDSGANSVQRSNSKHVEYYTNMELCSQTQMSEEADNILSRMDKLRMFANEQQAKRVKSQRRQRSFCF